MHSERQTRPLLTIGTAVYDDFEGAFWTWVMLRLYHAEETRDAEFLIIDNNPGSEQGKMLAQELGGLAGVRYLPSSEVVGTSAPRDKVFREARGEVVVCLDSHVAIVPGGLKALLDYYRENPESADLLCGPLLYPHGAISTHFTPVWSSEMLGQWAQAWRCPCGKWAFDVSAGFNPQMDATGRFCLYRPLLGARGETDFHSVCPICQKQLPELRYELHENHLENLGYQRLGKNLADPPFEIPAQGLGLFSCRKDAWLGFNPRFRGFGGEEWYIHGKYRQAGHKVLCLPALRWLHRFGRADTTCPHCQKKASGVKYPLTLWHKVRNYVIGHTELGWDLAPIEDHFVDSLPDEKGNVTKRKLNRLEWDTIVKDPTNPPEWPPQEVIQKVTGQKSAPSCCGGTIEPNTTLEQLYERGWKTPSDINEHCPKLRELASQCETVVEFGHRLEVSTLALLAGQPKRLISHSSGNFAPVLDSRKGKTEFIYQPGNPEQFEPTDCDMLFLDVIPHVADRLYADLSRHAAHAKRYIVMHDTLVYGEIGEGGGPGLLPALRRFTKEHGEWSVIYHSQINNGLTILSRNPADKKSLPGKVKMVWNYAKALVAHKTSGSKILPKEHGEARLDVCAICDQRADDRCTVCGCYLSEVPEGLPIAPGPGRAWWAEQECPLGKWQETDKRFALKITEGG